MMRQEKFGNFLTYENKMVLLYFNPINTIGQYFIFVYEQDILDVGAYYNPIYSFLGKKHCPKSVVIVEPILDAFSGYVSCPSGNGFTHIVILPITFRHYTTVKNQVPKSDAVVCIGCDSHYGPNRRLLESTFGRPFTLYLEYPSEYVHNAAYKKMGKGMSENMTYYLEYEVHTKATQYTKRVMKVINYT